MIILPKTIENKKVILDSIKTEIKSINNDINSQNDLKRKIVSYFRDFVYHIDFLQLDYISDSLKNIVSYLDISDATLDIYEALLAQVYDIRVQVKKNSDIDKYKKLIDIYNNKYEEQSKIITSNVNKINSLFSTSFTGIHTDTENLENTLVIDEINSQVILPYNLKDVYNLLKHDTTYNTINDAINALYRKPLSHFKNAPISRFREAYKLIKEREHGSTKEAVDLGLELMFNGKLHPAIITSCKTLDQLDIYLSCLEYNELNDFHFFKVLYKALPETKKKRSILKDKFSGQLQKILEQSKEIVSKIPSRTELFNEAEDNFNAKLQEIKQKHDAAMIPEAAQDKFLITGYKTIHFGQEDVENLDEELDLFTITGFKTFALEKKVKAEETKVPEVKETIVPEIKETIVPKVEAITKTKKPKTKSEEIINKYKENIATRIEKINKTKIAKQEKDKKSTEKIAIIEKEIDSSKEIINDLIDSIQDNYNGTRHTRVEKDIMTVVEERKAEKEKTGRITIIKATTMRTSDNAEKDRKAEEARRASLRVITGAKTIQLPKEKLFTITGYKSFKLEKKKPSFTITGYRIFKLQKPLFTITGYRIFKLQKPLFTITGYRIFKLQKPLFTITGYRIFKLQQPLFIITGYRTMHFGLGDIDNLPEETNIEAALQSLSDQTPEAPINQVSDVIGKLKQLQASSKYYYVPPTTLKSQPNESDIVDGAKEESEEVQADSRHDNFNNRFNITKINTTLQEDPLLSAIESLDDFEEDGRTHNSYSESNNFEDERLVANDEHSVEIPLVKSIKRSKKKASRKK